MKTDFNNRANIPIKGKSNTWFSNVISKLQNLDLDNGVVKLTKNNSGIIEQHIKNNPSYNLDLTKKIYEYWSGSGRNPKIRKAVMDLVRVIDIENSTNVWRYDKSKPQPGNLNSFTDVQLTKMVDFIVDPGRNFWDRLKNTDVTLVNDLQNSANWKGKNGNGPKSLASKICKYFSELYCGIDGYYINDSVVRHVLPYYVYYYENRGSNRLKFTKKLGKTTKTAYDDIAYSDLYKLLDDLRHEINRVDNQNLTRNELDHLLWYCYRFESN